MGLTEYRQQLDTIDSQIVKLFEERMRVCEAVAEDKIKNKKRVLDRQREQEKLAAVGSMVGEGFDRQAVTELFSQIMTISRRRQYQMMRDMGQMRRMPFIPVDSLEEAADERGMQVVYQGAEGSYSEAAMHKYFGEDVSCFNVLTFREAMIAIEEGSADYAVLPIENSTAGAVNEIYDLLSKFENYIVGEQVIPVRHCLMGVPGTTLSTIRRVYSHPQSLMQSERFLNHHSGWTKISMDNNAFAARKVADDRDVTQAAIASSYAAKRYGLEIIEEGVNQSESNSTRFIIVTNRKIYLKKASKISLCLEISHESGSLYHLLSHFIYNNLNMTRIESRPIEDRAWEYRFFIDFDGNLADSPVQNALRGLRDEAAYMKILGNY